jgi:PAS domain S-box-containing protein
MGSFPVRILNVSANEEMYRRIVEAVPEGIWVVSPQGRTIFCNERVAEILGTDVESLQRLSCFDAVFPADLEEAQRQFGLQMAGGGRTFDFRLRRIDGSAVWVSISCMPMYDDGGVCIGLLGLFTDISERRRAERGLRESEELFRAIFSQAAVGITQCGVSGEWLLLNDRFCEIVGYTRAELQGKTVFDITHPDDREACVAAVNRLLAGEIPSYPAEKRYIRKGGAVIWVRAFVTPVWGADKRLQYFIGVVEDITEKVQRERALRDSEQRLALAQNAGHLGVWDCDLRTNTTVISEEYGRLHGLGPDHSPLTHEEWMELVHPADRERVQVLLRESIDQTHLWDAEFRVLWPDGSVHWLHGKGKVFLDDSGLPIRMAGVSIDITERKQAEEVRSHLAAIVESSDDAIIGKTLHGEIVSWNPGAKRIYGYKAEEMVGRSISLLVPQTVRTRFHRYWSGCATVSVSNTTKQPAYGRTVVESRYR